MMTVIFTFEDLNDAFIGCDEDIPHFSKQEKIWYFIKVLYFSLIQVFRNSSLKPPRDCQWVGHSSERKNCQSFTQDMEDVFSCGQTDN